jgi:hypothetical protein
MSSPRSAYDLLLFLYPKSYREKYGDQIIQTIEDMLDNEPHVLRKASIWAKEIIVLPGNVLEQHMAVVAHRRNLTPNILIGLVALTLLVPFFVASVLDELSEYFANQHLYDSWFWSKPMLTIWVIILPMMSLFVSLATWAVLALRASIKNRRVTLQFKKLRLIVIVALVSFGTLFITVVYNGFGCWSHGASLNKAIQCTETIFLNADKK